MQGEDSGMCTAITYKTKDFYFGRTLDFNFTYGEDVTITPRNFCFRFRKAGVFCSHYAMIGMAHVEDNYPMYYEAVNEKGLGVGGLNFVGNAHYEKNVEEGKYNVAPFEFIPWILAQCATVKEAKEFIRNLNLVDIPFREDLPQAQLHWIITDCDESITVESTQSGIHVYDNQVGVLTNNPGFEEQMFQLNNYMYLSTGQPQNNFCKSLQLKAYSNGMGALGLPGDWSSQSRFIKVAFAKLNSVCGDSEMESVSQFFRILSCVEQLKGCCSMGKDEYNITFYTSCCNTRTGVYYYTTYNNHQIPAVDMHKVNLEDSSLMRYRPICDEQIRLQN